MSVYITDEPIDEDGKYFDIDIIDDIDYVLKY